MIATALTLILMALVVQVFAMVGTAASDTARSAADNRPLCATKLTCRAIWQIDRPHAAAAEARTGRGLLRVHRRASRSGAIGQHDRGNIDELDNTGGLPMPDTTVGDPDDILMFTTRNEERPFYGRYREAYNYTGTTGSRTNTGLTERRVKLCGDRSGSSEATRCIVAFFRQAEMSIGDNTVFLLSTNRLLMPAPWTYDISFYDKFDISVHPGGRTVGLEGWYYGAAPNLVANSLSDLTEERKQLRTPALEFILTTFGSGEPWGCRLSRMHFLHEYAFDIDSGCRSLAVSPL